MKAQALLKPTKRLARGFDRNVAQTRVRVSSQAPMNSLPEIQMQMER